MIDIDDLRKQPKEYQKAAKNKGIDISVDEFLKLDELRRELTQFVEEMRAEKNSVSKKIPTMKEKEKQDAIADMKKLDKTLSGKEEELKTVEEKWRTLFLQFPNLPLPTVPIGYSEEENVVIRSHGTPREFSFPVRDHIAIGEALDIIDIKTAATVSGSRFAYLKGDAVRLQMALIQFTFNTLGDEDTLRTVAKKAGLSVSTKAFLPILPPVIMRQDIMDRMDRLHPADQRYLLPEDNQVFVGSAEHTLGPYYMEHIFEEAELPIRFIGYSTSFRREAGTYGKDMHGILRVHQFDKLEVESFTTTEAGSDEQQFIVALQEYLLQQLEIPYRVVQKCTFDIGKPNANGVDIDCWIPSQDTYRETHTSDYMTDFQARRLGTRYKTPDGEKHFVHMNDATAFAIGRTIIAILENHQQADGCITVPKILRPYMGGKDMIR